MYAPWSSRSWISRALHIEELHQFQNIQKYYRISDGVGVTRWAVERWCVGGTGGECRALVAGLWVGEWVGGWVVEGEG